MSRIRTIKPEFWTDDLICSLTLCERLLFIASWNLADDEGRLVWTGASLKGAVFSADDEIAISDVERMMKSLESTGLLVAYVGGRSKQRLGFIRNFKKHQRINRPQPSRHPSPPSEPDQTGTESIPSGPNQVGLNGSLNHSVNGSLTEGKGREGEGKEDSVASATAAEKPDLEPKPDDAPTPSNVVQLPVAPDPEALEREVFRLGREVLGKESGGLIAKLWRVVDKDPARATTALERAAKKYDAREWLAGQINTMTQARAGPPAKSHNPAVRAALRRLEAQS